MFTQENIQLRGKKMHENYWDYYFKNILVFDEMILKWFVIKE